MYRKIGLVYPKLKTGHNVSSSFFLSPLLGMQGPFITLTTFWAISLALNFVLNFVLLYSSKFLLLLLLLRAPTDIWFFFEANLKIHLCNSLTDNKRASGRDNLVQMKSFKSFYISKYLPKQYWF